MKMKNKYFITLFLIFLIVGCTGNGNKDTAKLERDLYKGTIGISIDFFDNKLTDEVYEEETLNFIVRIDNKGPYEVNNAKYLVTVEPSFMEFDNNDNVYEKTNVHLDGKTIFNHKTNA